MPLESASFVNQLDQTRPTATDVKSEGDDVMRLIKSTLKNSFPNVGGAMNASHTELNRSVGLTEDIQPRLSATIAAPGGETLNRLPAAASRLGGYLTFNASTGQPEVNFSIGQASASSVGIFNASNITTFFTAGTERMRIDATGVRAASSFAVGDSSGNLSGAMLNESDTSKSVTFAADPGNVGASSFMRFNVDGTERMRLDGVGNVGIGRTPVAKLDVIGSGACIVRARGASGAGQGAGFYFTVPDSEQTMGAFGDRAAAFGGTPGQLASIYTLAQPLTFDVAGAERMRIDASGNVGIGTASPAAKLEVRDVNGTIIASNSATRYGFMQWENTGGTLRLGTDGSFPIRFDTAATERMRIDASGNVISNVNTTAPTLSTNQQMVFALTSNTNLRISVRGTDGVTRVANITLA